MRTKISLLFLLFFTISAAVLAEKVEINKIASNPGVYNQSFVTIEGTVTQYTPSVNASTAFYIIRGDYGGLLQVNTNSKRPKVNERYTVEGTVVVDGSGVSYLVEKNKSTFVIPLPPVITDKTWMYVSGIIGFVFLLVIVVFVINKQKNKVSPNVSKSASASQQRAAAQPPVTANDFKTIRVNLNDAPKTMKLMPGLLEISAGPDKGKQFYISGFQTPYGNVVTIGREEVQGDKKYAHIQLYDNTISRKQAEIISVGEKTFVKNLSQVNYTLLDGEKIEANDMKELSLGSVIKTGAVEFTYRLN